MPGIKWLPFGIASAHRFFLTEQLPMFRFHGFPKNAALQSGEDTTNEEQPHTIFFHTMLTGSTFAGHKLDDVLSRGFR